MDVNFILSAGADKIIDLLEEFAMALFEKQFTEIREYLKQRAASPAYREFVHAAPAEWPSGMKRSVVLSQEMAVELGSPQQESSSCLIWHDDPARVRDGLITLIGTDLTASAGKSLPFGKIVLIAAAGFNEENTYDRYRELDGVRYELDLKGYMMRAVSQYGREWSRVSKEAIEGGFSFSVLGGSLIDAYRRRECVRAAEVIFVTASREDVAALAPVADGAMRIIGAMNKMLEELEYDCNTCENTDVCGDVAELRSMRERLIQKGEKKHAR
jgi:CO dehydrogenase/acetyl-CoA synthase beta subunit